jgi:pimeloyl-ACP methyl ester carboxylesterase
MESIERSGIDIATETFGSCSDPCLLLIMGATASMLSWPDTLCRRLADAGLYVVRFDHRDTGASTTVPPGEADYSVEDMAGDVISILNRLGVDRAHLMGMSLGGYIAQMLALTHAERLLSLTLVASEPLGWDGDRLPHIRPEILDHFSGLTVIDWSSQTAIASFLLELERLNSGTGAAFDEEAAHARILQGLSRTQSPASMFNHASLDVRKDWSGGYRRIRLPVLVIHGEEDPVLPVENGQALAEGIPSSLLVTFEGTGHELPERDHERMVRVVTEHIRKCSP